MIGREKRVLLRHYLEQGVPKAAIARDVGVSRETIYRWIATGQLDRDLDDEAVRYRPRVPAPSRLDPYKGIIDTRLADYPRLSAVRLFNEVRAAGYPGGYGQVKRYVRKVRPREPVEPVRRFETPPGHQGQVDFADFRLPWGKRHALIVVLGYSRRMWLKFYERQTMPVVMRGLEASFAYFGGVPSELLFDQMKAVVIGDKRDEGGRLVENPEFLSFSRHWRFRIRACRPYRAQTKGKVERPVRYLRDNFFYGRDFVSDDDLNARALLWLDSVANVRIHGTLKERVADRFDRERLCLSPPGPLALPSRGAAAGAPDDPDPATHGTPGCGGRTPAAVRVRRDHGRDLVKARSRSTRIAAQLADLKMPGALEALDEVLAGVDGGGTTAAEAIERLLAAQITLRNSRRLATAMRSSRLPAIKTLADFDFSFQPSVKREQIDSLHELGFLERKENVVFLGPPGVGKTHLAISLAIAAAESGRRVYYGTLTDLIDSLEEAEAAGRLNHRLKTLTHPALLVVDEIGYLPVTRSGAILFFQLVNRRYEHASTVLTSNKGFEQWGEILHDEVMAAALLDRLLHRCHMVNIRGNSYRMRRHAELSKAIHPTASRAVSADRSEHGGTR